MNIEIGQMWYHSKTMTTCRITGFCILEATLKPAILYTDGDHDSFGELLVYARDKQEFLDGRFKLIESL